MTNPNCEYSLNVPAIVHVTLSEWVHNPAWDPSGLDAHNVDLICQMFWLPHSHGPLVNKLLRDLQYCKENVAVMYTEGKRTKGDLSEATEDWLDCYGGVRDIIETFGNVCDKTTHIANRDLLYDLSPYITNINMLLHGWNSYLKWVAVHNCKKPLQGGPTLCGLLGGLAGDLMRLYPVQAEDEYPLKAPVMIGSSEKNLPLVVLNLF